MPYMSACFEDRSSPQGIPNHPTTITPPPCRSLAPPWAAAYRLNRSLVVAATRLEAQLDGVSSAAPPTTDLEQLQQEASGLSTRAAGAIELVKCGLVMLEHAAVEAAVEVVSRAAAFQQLLGVDVLRQSFMSHLSDAAREVSERRTLPPPTYWLPLLHVTAAATRHAAASGLTGAEQPVEEALDVVTFFLGTDVALEQPVIQQGLQLAIQTVGRAAAALGRAARVADVSSIGSSWEAGDARSTSPGLGGVLLFSVLQWGR